MMNSVNDAPERVLVSGGAGFIGSFVARRLLELGHEVCVFDAFITYSARPSRVDELAAQKRLHGLQQASVVRGSTLDPDLLQRTLGEFAPTRIVHLATLPLVNLARERPAEANQSIVQGTLNLLHAARELPDLRRFVHLSSSMVYGDFRELPAREDHPTAPKDIYGGLKLSAETLCQVMARQYGLDITILRPSAVYGPLDSNRRVVSTFLDNALAGRPLHVHGPETCLDFTYVTDLAEGIVQAAFRPEASMQTFNITRGIGRTTLEAAQIIASLVPGTDVEVHPQDTNRARRGALDISRARELLGYTPTVDLEEGIARYLVHCRELLAELDRPLAEARQ